jgi:hypothetical protein
MPPQISRKTYVVKPSDSLSTIAQKFGIRDWKVIYYAACNEPLRSKRKNPNLLQPGDPVVIPLQLSDLRSYNEQRLRQLLSIRADLNRIYDEQLKDLESAFNKAQRTANAVDTVKTFIDIGSDVTSAAKVAEMTIGKKGKVLKALNEEFLKKAEEVYKDVYNAGVRDPMLEAAVKDRQAAKDGVLWAIGRIAVETLLKYDTPSFWAWTYVQLRSGKSWSESVSTSPEDAFAESKTDLQRARADALRNIDKRVWELRKVMMKS